MVDLLSLRIFPLSKKVSLAQKSINSRSNGFAVVDFKLGLNDKLYTSVPLTIMKDLCCDVVLGREFQSRHLKVTFEYGGYLPELVVKGTGACLALEAADIAEPTSQEIQLNANRLLLNQDVLIKRTLILLLWKLENFWKMGLLNPVFHRGVHN